jgi:TATA-box binding protein (TBP) (component of TFIID and TFIIIB)
MSVSIPLKISTITAIGRLNAGVDIRRLYEHLDLLGDDSDGLDGVTYAEHAPKKGPHESRGRSQTKSRRRASNRPFDNQTTVVLKLDGSYVNVKVFQNGNVQMTGLRRIERGPVAMAYLCEVIKRIASTRDPEVCEDVAKLSPSHFVVCLINSDFKVDFEIRRDRLFNLLTSRYRVSCSYEPCIYPGVKIHYYWSRKDRSSGCCACATKCQGRGEGEDPAGQCRKITIAVFQSGCIIVTGGHSYEQVDDAYAFITRALFEHLDLVRKPFNS